MPTDSEIMAGVEAVGNIKRAYFGFPPMKTSTIDYVAMPQLWNEVKAALEAAEKVREEK